MKKYNKKNVHLLILGSLPPPRGGVTTHIERLIPYAKEAGIGVYIWDHSKKRNKSHYIISLFRETLKALLFCIFQPGIKVLHFPVCIVTFSKIMFLFFMKCIGVRVTTTFVASPEQSMGNSPYSRYYIFILARYSSYIIVNNRDFQKLLVNNRIPASKIAIIPAFIPIKDELKNDLIIPEYSIDFCKNQKPLMLTYAFGPDFHKGEDLYGLDLIVQLAQKLKSDYPEIGFVVVIPEITNYDYLKTLMVNIRENGLEDSFCFVIGNEFSFIPFLQYADVFIRATNTDGDALTLREACYYSVTSVASNVCCRPEGTLLFRNRDIHDLHRSVRVALSDKNNECHNNIQNNINNADLFINMFKRVALVRD